MIKLPQCLPRAKRYDSSSSTPEFRGDKPLRLRWNEEDLSILLPIYAAIGRANRAAAVNNRLPAVGENGFLPPGIHKSTWLEFVVRFGWNHRRRWLLQGLGRQLRMLRHAGCHHVFVGGSLISTKPRPTDFDGCFDISHIDRRKLWELEPRLWSTSGAQSLQKQHGGVLFPSLYLPTLQSTTIEFLQFDSRSGEHKGIVLVQEDD